MNATDIMTPDVIYAAPDTPLRDLVRLMLDNHVSALPIVEYGRIVGIVMRATCSVVSNSAPSPDRPPGRPC